MTLFPRVTAALAATFLGIAACSDPLAVASLPPTRALESGAADALTTARSFEISGEYTEGSDRWSIDVQIVPPATEHAVLVGPTVKLETIVVGGSAYYRGEQFLIQHTESDPNTQSLVRAAGNAWWKATTAGLVSLPDFTDGASFRTTFLGPLASRRIDNVAVDGQPAVDLAGVRGDVYIAAHPPYQPLRVHLNQRVSVDGLGEADLRFTNFNKEFGISAPRDVIDFSNLSTLPPIYFVVSIDTSGCGSPCVLAAQLKNVGGQAGAKSSSAVTFTVTDAASGRQVGSCTVVITPDVGYNATTSAGCTIGSLNGQNLNAAIVSATVDNPGRA
jgi:hypothetical protein